MTYCWTLIKCNCWLWNVDHVQLVNFVKCWSWMMVIGRALIMRRWLTGERWSSVNVDCVMLIMCRWQSAERWSRVNVECRTLYICIGVMLTLWWFIPIDKMLLDYVLLALLGVLLSATPLSDEEPYVPVFLRPVLDWVPVSSVSCFPKQN
jgi:hypothetical protein